MIRSIGNIGPQIPRHAPRRYQSHLKSCDPLRILFCGSDDFSVASLQALHRKHAVDRELVESIDVVCRPGKRVDAGLKRIREVPIYHAAKELQLPLHQIDTFRGWSPPLTSNGNLINLIVAVSFGLLVPPRLLNGAKYGGLNVHPSLLPQYRGAAPIHHTLLDACARTGVTLQTLHPSRMDHGQILAQTPAPGIPVAPADEDCVARLTATLASLGASMLVEGLEKRLFVPPVEDLAPTLEPRDPTTLKHAHKIAPEDRHIDWTTWSAAQILRYGRVIGPLWSYVEEASSHTKHRCIWPTGFKSVEAFVREDCEAGDCVPPRLDGLVCRPGIGYVSPRRDYVMLGTADAKFLVARTATLAGLKKGVPIGDAFVKTGVLPPGIWQEARKSGEAIAVSKPFT